MTIRYDYPNNLIHIENGQTTVDIQALIDSIRIQEASEEGIAYAGIAEASGKEPLGDNVNVGITVFLLPPWQIKFAPGPYIAKIGGGNLVGGIAGDPVAYSPGVQVLLIQSAASTVVTIGSGVTEQDKDDIVSKVWNAQISDYQSAGSMGAYLSKKLLTIVKFLGFK